jgi:hypothetical protein
MIDRTLIIDEESCSSSMLSKGKVQRTGFSSMQEATDV